MNNEIPVVADTTQTHGKNKIQTLKSFFWKHIYINRET